MHKNKFYLISLIASTSIMIVGAVFKIQHSGNAQFFLLLGGTLSIPFVYLGITDALGDNKNQPIVKLMWGVGFIFLTWIAGFAYLSIFKKKNTAS